MQNLGNALINTVSLGIMIKPVLYFVSDAFAILRTGKTCRETGIKVACATINLTFPDFNLQSK